MIDLARIWAVTKWAGYTLGLFAVGYLAGLRAIEMPEVDLEPVRAQPRLVCELKTIHPATDGGALVIMHVPPELVGSGTGTAER